MNLNLNTTSNFVKRHIGPSSSQKEEMLKVIGLSTVDDLINETIPGSIRLDKKLDLPKGISEDQFINKFSLLAKKNKVYKSYIGLGYFNTFTPPIIQRNILENPGWYTAYTPYQAEISQGRLEALINFQSLAIDLSGMEIANASLLDEGTAAAEAMAMFLSLRKREKKSSTKFLVDEGLFPQTKEILITRAKPIGVNIEIKKITESDLNDPELFGVIFQYPDQNGQINDYRSLVKAAKASNLFTAFAADLLSLA